MVEEANTCRLCGAEGPLCRSHIVPEFAYAPIKNEKNQIYSVGQRVRKVQTGYFEHMLCRDCEALLSEYERAFKRDWMDTIPPDFTHLQTRSLQDVISVALTDYDAFKLFHLSVLWRAAVSSGFKAGPMSLGPYTDQLQTLITNRDPGSVGDFPFIAVLNLDDQGRPVATVSQLAKGEGRYEGHHYYMMSYAFCDWTFIVARPGPKWMIELEATCRADGQFLLLTTRHKQSKSFNLWASIIHDLRK